MPTDPRTYITVHDGMPDHPKIKVLSDAGFRLLVEGWCWCSRYLTDGFMPANVWEKFGKKSTRNELLGAQRVHEVQGGKFVQFHDYLEHQRSRAQVEDLQRKRRRAGSVGGLSRANAQASAKANAQALAKQELKQNPSKIQAETDTESLVVKEEDSYVSSGIENEPRSKPVRVESGRLARIYCDKVKLSNFGHVASTISIALAAGYDADQIAPALERLANDGRSVTENTLRIEIENAGKPVQSGSTQFVVNSNGMHYEVY